MLTRTIIVLEEYEDTDDDITHDDIIMNAHATANDICEKMGRMNVISVGVLPK
jgi:hypothetical protein